MQLAGGVNFAVGLPDKLHRVFAEIDGHAVLGKLVNSPFGNQIRDHPVFGFGIGVIVEADGGTGGGEHGSRLRRGGAAQTGLRSRDVAAFTQ